MPGLALRISRLTAFGLLAVALVAPWFRVPIALSQSTQGLYKVAFAEPITTLGLRVLIAVVLLVALWVGYRRRRSESYGWAAPMRAAGCILLLSSGIVYPALTTQRCTGISSRAAWLQAQHDSFIGPFGDIFTAQEYENQSDQPEVQVKEIFPRAFEVFPTPLITSFADLRISKLEEILMWLGLSPAFCDFASLGWFSGMFGSFLLVISFLRTKEDERINDHEIRLSWGFVPAFFLGAFLACSLCLLPIVVAGWVLTKAQTAAAGGDFAASLHDIDVAQSWVPALAYHTDILYQRGFLEQKLGLSTTTTRLFTAIREEEESFYSRAADHYFGLTDPAVSKPVRDEAFRGVLRLTIKDLNSGLVERAGRQLDRLLALDPTCLKANYALQFVDLRTRQKARLEADVSQFEALYRSVQSIEKGVVVASAHRRLADLEFDFKDRTKLGDEMRAAIKPD